MKTVHKTLVAGRFVKFTRAWEVFGREDIFSNQHKKCIAITFTISPYDNSQWSLKCFLSKCHMIRHPISAIVITSWTSIFEGKLVFWFCITLNLSVRIAVKYIKVNKSRKEQCGVSLHFSIGQNLLKKILRKDKYWQNQLRKVFWQIRWPQIMQYTLTH